MRNQTAKKIRTIFGVSRDPDNQIIRRMYRRFKKLYSRTPNNQRNTLLKKAQDYLNTQKQQ